MTLNRGGVLLPQQPPPPSASLCCARSDFSAGCLRLFILMPAAIYSASSL